MSDTREVCWFRASDDALAVEVADWLTETTKRTHYIRTTPDLSVVYTVLDDGEA